MLADGWLAQVLLAARLGYGAWDIVHHRIDKVVWGWYAEIRTVLDVLLAVGTLLAVPAICRWSAAG